MKILITGSGGQLGRELVMQARDKVLEPLAMNHADLDITRLDRTRKVIAGLTPCLVINASAYTDVDGAETHMEAAYAVNRDGPAHLASVCSAFSIPLIHISTDFVFDGKKKTPYLESDPVSPLSVYGKSKAEGETAVRTTWRRHLIVRTSWMYSGHGHNFVKTMLNLGREKDRLSVVADQYGCPTNAADLARAILVMAQKIIAGGEISWGTYHYCGQGTTTWHGFAEAIFSLAASYENLKIRQVKPITSDQYPSPARRPLRSSLDCSRILDRFAVRTIPWRQSLAGVIGKIYS
ncbi:MAG: dTDP-4-dehydrorhamnose reductase [Deltaproteobacteria bacterium]|nr:MAG: dTDP-4-dehydrorhamnose reductase [Deltaproteobacteria bacterium]